MTLDRPASHHQRPHHSDPLQWRTVTKMMASLRSSHQTGVGQSLVARPLTYEHDERMRMNGMSVEIDPHFHIGTGLASCRTSE